jgi:sugar phosphate isomerase/epimerase
MKLAFSTLGCPNWNLIEVVQAARAYGYQAIELRALGGSLDLLRRPELQPREVEITSSWLSDHGATICCVDTSCSFDAVDEAERRKQVQIAVRHCELAAALGAPLIRVFPDKIPAGATRAETRDRIAQSLREVAEVAPRSVRVGVETHGDFASGPATAEIAALAGHPNVAIIWDAANTFASGEGVEESARAVAPYLAHVHLRDARPEGKEHWTPVLAGRGRVPLRSVVEALRALNYEGHISFEWEKYWHPEIEEPEVAIPDFAAAMRNLLGANGKSVEAAEAPGL